MKLFKMIKQTADTQIFLDMGLFKYGKTYAIDLGINGMRPEPDELPHFTFEKYCTTPVNTEDNGEMRLWFKSCVSGIRCIIDPTDTATTSSVEIYEVEEAKDPGCETAYMEKLDWVHIRIIPFDTCFFKVGHPYLIRKSARCCEYYAGILASMSPYEMKFISIDSNESTNLGPGEYVETFDIHTVEDYKCHECGVWYKALLPTDVWSDAPSSHPIVNIRKYIKKRRDEACELEQEILDEIDGVIVSEFNAAFGGLIDDDLYLDTGGFDIDDRKK